MTISTSSSSATGYGNGSTIVWAFGFLIPAANEVVVTVTDNTVSPATVTTLSSSQYSITGLNNATGGTVTYPLSGSPLISGQNITIQRVLPLKQQTSIKNQGAFYPAAVEAALDYGMMAIQQINDTLSLCVQVPEGSGITPADYLTTIQTDVNTTNANVSASASSAAAAAESAAESAASAVAASGAATSETNAAASAAAAAKSETNAATSEANAAASESAAKISETNAAVSETNASAAAAAAADSQAAAMNSQTASSTSASSASASALAAQESATASSTSANQAAISLAGVQAIVSAAGSGCTFNLGSRMTGSSSYIGGRRI